MDEVVRPIDDEHAPSRFGISTFVRDIGRFVRLAERQGTRLVDLVERWVEATERNATATERHAEATERLVETMGGRGGENE